jgi:hypothetical protein
MTFKQSVAVVTAIASVVLLAPVSASAPSSTVQQAVVGASNLTISGTVERNGSTVANVRLRVRNVNTGTVVGQTTSDQTGAFSFTVPTAGLYVVEAINDDGKVIGASSAMNISTTPLTTTVILSSTKAAAVFSSAPLILAVAGAAGIATIVIINDHPVSSPER